MSCVNTLTDSFLRECAYKPKAGLEPDVWLVNLADIDKAVSQLATSGMLISTFALAAGKTLFKAEGAGNYPQGTVTLSQGDNGPNHIHGLTVRVLYYGEDERLQVKQMIDNGRFAAIVKKRDGGLSGELKYEVLGWESGMQVESMTWSSNENNGVRELVLATKEGEEESTDAKLFVDTDLATTESFLETNTFGYVPPGP